MNRTKKTLDGRTVRYSDWLTKVAAEADRVNLSEAGREIANGAYLKDSWEHNLFPTYVVRRLQVLAGDVPDEHPNDSAKAAGC